MYFFLPDDVTKNLTLIEEALTAEFVQDLANTLHPVQVQLTLPVLKLGYSTELLGPLSDIGKTIFFFFSLFLVKCCFEFGFHVEMSFLFTNLIATYVTV